MTAATRPTLAYRPELDGIRAVAVLAVLGFHLAFTVPSLRHFFRGGFLGVDIFFVLSGMLITELLVNDHRRNGSISLAGFYRRRAQRLLPALAVFLVVITAYYAIAHDRGAATVRSLGTIVTYVTTGHLHGQFATGVAHVWTLVVEWEFYLVWPLLLSLGLRRGLTVRTMGYVAAGLAVALTVVRATQLLADGGNTNVSYYLAWLRFDELLVGCAVGLLGARPQGPPWLRTLCLAGLLGVISQAAATDRWLYLGGMLGIAVCAAVVVQPRERSWGVDRILASPPMVWVGRLSYSLYLWSVPIVSEFGHHAASWPPVLRLIACVATSFGFAAASYYLVERRFRLPSRRSLASAVPA
jgi:peptidoglycan/LPS O-acetylase OafA/YrhL